MRHFALCLALLLACGPAEMPASGARWRIAQRLVIEDGAWLLPDDPTRPGEAAPTAFIRLDDELWVLYANLNAFRPAGVGWLARHDAKTLERTLLVRLTYEGLECRNPVALTRDGAELHIACAGVISFAEPSADGVVMTFDLRTERIIRAGSVGHSPGSVAAVGGFLWLGDGEGGGVWKVSSETLEAPERHVPCTIDATHEGYVADLVEHEGRLFASCFNDDTIVELDPNTGERLGAAVQAGDAPVKLASIDGRVFALDNLGGTLTIVSPGPPPTSRPAAIALGRASQQGGNDPQGLAGDGRVLGVTNSAWGSFVVVDLDTETLVESIDLKATPDSPTNFPTAVTYADGVFHVLVPGLEQSRNDVPGEIIRIVRESP